MKYIVSLLLSILLLVTPFLVLSHVTFTYHFIYSFTGIYDDMPRDLIEEATDSFIGIIHGDGDMLIKHNGESLFKAQEIFHMYEVRGIFSTLKKVMLFFLLVVILYIVIKKDYSVLKLQFYINVLLVVFFAMLSPFFSSAFDTFHRIIFHNEYWLFTSEHYLINILTLDFFLYFLLIGLLSSFVFSTGLFFLERRVRWLEYLLEETLNKRENTFTI